MSKILVTGCLGTLGRPLCKKLRENGHEVFGIDLVHSEEQKDFDDYRYHRCDIRNYRKLQEVLDAVMPEYIYHLAAEFGRHNGEQYYEDLWSTNVIGTRNILEYIKSTRRFIDLGDDENPKFEEHPIKLIFASSSEVYGETVADKFYEDLTDNQRIYHHNDYAESKFVNENQIRRYIKQYGIEAQVLRFFNSYGPGEKFHAYRSVIALWTYKLLHKLPITVFDNYHRVFMYIDDFIETLSKICDDFKPGTTYNIGGSEYRNVKDAADLILEEIDQKIPNSKKLLEKMVIIKEEDAHNTVNKNPDISNIVKDYGHNPSTPLEMGIRETVKWQYDYYKKSIKEIWG